MTEEIINILHEGQYTCVIKNSSGIHTFTNRGVADLYDLYTDNPEFLAGASVADKAVGKAAASLMILGGVASVYTDVISSPALSMLRKANVEIRFATEVPFIKNRDKSGWCPMEAAGKDINTPEAMYPVIKELIHKMRQGLNAITAIILCALSLTAAKAQTGNDSIAKSISIDEVVVTGTRSETDIRHLPMTVSIIDRHSLETSRQTSVLPVLNEQVPGFFSTSRGMLGYGISTGAAGQMSVRGIGGPAQAGVPTTGVLVLIDGHPQYMGLFGHPISDSYQSMMAERVEVLRGPASVLYGSNAMGGVVNIVTRKNDEEGVKTGIDIGAGSYGTVMTEAHNHVKKGRFSSTITASYNRTDGHRKDMNFEQYGGYAKLAYDISDNWNIWGDANITHFNASNPGTIDEPYLDNDQSITRGMASLAIENKYDRTSGTLSLFYNWGNHLINDGYQPGDKPLDYRFKSKDNMFGLSWYQNAYFFAGNRVTFGFDYFRYGGKAHQDYDDGHIENTVDKSIYETAGYVDFRQDIGTFFTIDAGLRVNYNSHTGTELVPQAGAAFRLPKDAEIRLMASKGFRNPTIREMFMFPPQNPDLKPEKIWSYELSYSQKLLDNRLTYGINLFYINGENLILRLPRPNGNGMLNQNSGDIENWGVEADISYRISKAWSITANYSRLHMENPVLASPENKLYAGIFFEQGRWQASTGVQYIKGLYTDLESDDTEDFVLWNIQGSFKILKQLSVYARAENILAQDYEIMAGYPMPHATFIGGLNLEF